MSHHSEATHRKTVDDIAGEIYMGCVMDYIDHAIKAHPLLCCAPVGIMVEDGDAKRYALVEVGELRAALGNFAMRFQGVGR